MKGGYGSHLWRDWPWSGEARRRPENVSDNVREGQGGYKLLAVQKSVCLEFAGAESCTFVGL